MAATGSAKQNTSTIANNKRPAPPPDHTPNVVVKKTKKSEEDVSPVYEVVDLGKIENIPKETIDFLHAAKVRLCKITVYYMRWILTHNYRILETGVVVPVGWSTSSSGSSELFRPRNVMRSLRSFYPLVSTLVPRGNSVRVTLIPP